MWTRRPRTWLLFVAALLVGALPFCKLQSLPLAAVLALLIMLTVGFVSRAEGRQVLARRLGAIVVGGLLPFLLLVSPLFLIGEQDAFLRGYIGLGASYTAASRGAGWSFIADNVDPYASIWLVPCLILSAAAGGLVLVRRAGPPAVVSYGPALAAAILSITALVTVLIPGRAFAHYTTYWTWLGNWCGVAIGIALAGSSSWRRVGRAGLSAFAVGAAGVILFAGWPGWQSSVGSGARWVEQSAAPNSLLHRRPLLFDWLGVDTRRLAVWGWASDIYNLAGAEPVGRETQTTFLLPEVAGSDYYRARMLSDVARRPDFDLIVDAVASGEFAYSGLARYPLDKTFPELLRAGADPFVALATDWDKGNGVVCPRLYVRGSLLPAIRSRFVTFTSAVSSSALQRGPVGYGADRLVDRSVFDNCGDAWLLPDGQPSGTATLSFDAAALSEIWVLNTEDGDAFDRAARVISLSLRRGGAEVWRQEAADVAAYPSWTRILLPAGIEADTLVVTIDKSAGLGGGLNEIAIRRAQGPVAQGTTSP
jgi:hypothetical protein